MLFKSSLIGCKGVYFIEPVQNMRLSICLYCVLDFQNMQQHNLQLSYYKNAWLIYGVSTEKTTQALLEKKRTLLL
jgi:hypothetical protein